MFKLTHKMCVLLSLGLSAGGMLFMGCAAPECQFYNDCPNGQYCTTDGLCATQAELTCEEKEGSNVFALRGMLKSATAVGCRVPQSVDDGPAFTDANGVAVSLTGVPLRVDFGMDGISSLAGRTILIGSPNEYLWVPILPELSFGDGDPVINEGYTERGGRFISQFTILDSLPEGNVPLSFAIDDGTGTVLDPHPGAWFSLPTTVKSVNSGDVQVSLIWDEKMDVDMRVTSPTGDTLDYTSPTSSDGGELDLDSNAACSGQDLRAENIYWPVGAAPDGTYRVSVSLYAECDVPLGRTNYRLTILNGNNLITQEGVIDGSQGRDYVEIADFTFVR